MRPRTLRRGRGFIRVIALTTTTLSVIAVVFALALLVPGLLGFERYVITGDSMSGTIERGSLVFARAVPVETLAVNDVITYFPPPDSGITNLVTHRVSAIDVTAEGPVFYTKGDANESVDPWSFGLTAPTQAKVDFAVPAVGFVFIVLADPPTRIFVLGIPAALVALFCVVEIIVVVRSRATLATARLSELVAVS